MSAELNEKCEQHYYEITELYDLVDELASTVEHDAVKNKEAQMDLLEPLIVHISDAADVLTEEFIVIAENKTKKKTKTANKGRIESALRKIYMAIDEYQQTVAQSASQAAGAFRNVADPIVNKIKRQMETVVANFMEFVQLSLDRIMHKSQIEELKQRQERIALMLHQGTQQAT